MPGLNGLFAYEDYASAQQPVIFFEREQIAVLVRERIHGMQNFVDGIGPVLSRSALLHGGVAKQ